MSSYIPEIATLAAQAPASLIPSATELIAAGSVLAQCPVTTYPAFSEDEVCILGCYRYSFSLVDPIWKSVVIGLPEAWVIAVHEAAELDAYAGMGLNPFDKEQWLDGLEEAHLKATSVEVEFLKRWAEQSDLTLPELAIEIANPMRGQFPREHALLITKLIGTYGWPLPTENEQEAARQWWARILEQQR
jgi:hypothetical protein